MTNVKIHMSLLLILIAHMLLMSCKEFYHYRITNKESDTRSFTMKLDEYDVKIGFSGKYTLIADNGVYSAIELQVRNKSEVTFIIRTDKMKVSSRYFDYKLVSGEYDVEVRPGERRKFYLEYLSEAKNIVGNQIPKNEVLVLNVEGFAINGRVLSVDPIRFVPESS